MAVEREEVRRWEQGKGIWFRTRKIVLLLGGQHVCSVFHPFERGIPGWSPGMGSGVYLLLDMLCDSFRCPLFSLSLQCALEQQVMVLKIIYSYVSGVHWKLSNIFSALKFITFIGNSKFM